MRPERKPPKAKSPHGLKTMERPVISFDNPVVLELNSVHSFEDRSNLMQLKNVEKRKKKKSFHVSKSHIMTINSTNERI